MLCPPPQHRKCRCTPPHPVVSLAFCGPNSRPYAQTASILPPEPPPSPQNSTNNASLTHTRNAVLKMNSLGLLKRYAQCCETGSGMSQHTSHLETSTASSRAQGLLGNEHAIGVHSSCSVILLTLRSYSPTSTHLSRMPEWSLREAPALDPGCFTFTTHLSLEHRSRESHYRVSSQSCSDYMALFVATPTRGSK